MAGARRPRPRTTEHPHVEQPAKQAVREALADCPAPLRDLYLAVHDLVLEVEPTIAFELDLSDRMMGYARHQFGYGGWGGLALACHARWVSFAFMRGSELPDPSGILEGSGKSMRHVKLRSAQELADRRSAIRLLIEAALSPVA